MSSPNKPNIIVITPHTTSKLPSTHEESLSSIPSSCFHDHPNETTLLAQQDNLTITLTNKLPHSSHSILPNDPFEDHTQYQNNNHQSHPNMNHKFHDQTSIPNHNPTPPSSPSSEHEKFVEELKEAHELNALLALHLIQRNLDQQPTSTNSSPSNNLIHLENHVINCICCTYLEKQTFVLNEHLNWIEYLLTRTTQDYTNTPSPPLLCSSPSAPNAPSKTPSTQGTSTSSIPSSSSSINDYINTHLSPPPRTTISNKNLSSYHQNNSSLTLLMKTTPLHPSKNISTHNCLHHQKLSPLTPLDAHFS